MNPFDALDALLERIHKRSPVLAFLVAIAISAACMFAIAYLNADGSTVIPGVHA